MEFKIEKGIEIQESRTRGEKAKYPFKEMEIGDSFFVAISPNDNFKKRRNSIASIGTNYTPKSS